MRFPRQLLRRSSLLAAVTLGAGAWLAAGGAPAQQKGPFTEVLDVDLVNVDVVVADKNGNLVTDLERDDFTITDDGKKVNVEYFARLVGAAAPATATDAATPADGAVAASAAAGSRDARHVVLFIDLDAALLQSRNRVLGELGEYLTSHAQGLKTMVVTYGAAGLDVKLPFSTSPAEWMSAIEAAKELPGRGTARRAEQQRLVESIKEVQSHAESGDGAQASRNLLDAIMGNIRSQAEQTHMDGRRTLGAIQTLASVLSTVEGPKSLLYVGDGVSLHPGEDLYNLVADMFETDRRFTEAGGPRVMSPNPGAAARGDDGEPSAGVPEAGAGANDPNSEVTSMADSPNKMRAEALGFDLTPEMRAMTAIANSQRVTVYGLSSDAPGGTARADANAGSRGPSASAFRAYDTTRAQLIEQSLQVMAEETGGLALPPNADVDGFLDRVLADEGNRYSLAYVSPHGGDSRFHKIKVKVNRKGVTLRHREGYIDRPRQVRIGDLVAGALILGAGDNPHRVEMELVSQEPAQNDDVAVAFALRIPLDQLQLASAGDQHQTKLELYVLSQDGSGTLAPMRFVEVTVSVPADQMAAAAGQFYGATLPLALKKGPQTVAVGIVEPAAQRTSVVRTELEVGAGG